MGKIVKPDKEELKKDMQKLKEDFSAAVKDKKRWLACMIEIGIMLVLLATDLLIKHFVYGHCDTVGDIVIIDGVIRFTAVRNTGASFGMAKDHTVALTVVSLICAIILVFFIFYSYPRKNKWLRAALVMITAGAFGNVIDRLHFGYVRDMVYFELIDFAVFNFADSCLTVGTVVLIIYILFYYTKEEEEKKKQKEATALAEHINEMLSEADDEEEKPAVEYSPEVISETQESSVEEEKVAEEAPAEEANDTAKAIDTEQTIETEESGDTEEAIDTEESIDAEESENTEI